MITSKTIKKVSISWKTKDGEKKSAEKWQARYRDPNSGRQPSKNFNRKVDAQHWLDEQTAAIVTGNYVDPQNGKTTLRNFFDDWSQNQLWEPSTRENAEGAMRSCTFADLQLRAIRRSHVEAWIKQMDATLKPGTIKTRFLHVRQALRAAVADKLIASDPCERVVLPRPEKAAQGVEIPTVTEVSRLLAHADQTKRASTRIGFRAYVALCAFAGLRKSEALGVQVGDIDFLRRQLRVDRQLQRAKDEHFQNPKISTLTTKGKGWVAVTPPKYGSNRVIALPDELLQILSEHIATHTPDGDSDRWLFSDDGLPWHDNSVHWRWRGAKKDAGVETKLHDLRHFYASGLIAAGCDVVSVSKALGHASTSTTHKTYLHLWSSAEEKTRIAASKLAQEALTMHAPCTEELIQTASNQS